MCIALLEVPEKSKIGISDRPRDAEHQLLIYS